MILLLLAALPVGFHRIDQHSALNPHAASNVELVSGGGGASPATSFPPRKVLWEAGHEAGNLIEWWAPEPFEREGVNGGGEYNSGIADADVSSNVTHSGNWAAKLTIDTSTKSGSRLFRWLEPHAHRELYYEAWFYFPKLYRLTADPAIGSYWDVFQFKSSNESQTRNDPFWFLNVYNPTPDTLRARLAWWFGHGLEGPHQGEFGWRSYETRVNIPVGRWVQFSVFLRQSNGFDGAIKVWQDGDLVIDEENVRTGWPSSRFNPWGVDQAWSVNNYSDGLSPSPADIYVDDARISVGVTG